MTFNAYASYDGLGVAALIAGKKVKATEVMEAAIARAEAVNPRLNAIVFKDYARARQAASGKLAKGAFAGVPFLIKDIGCATEGLPSRNGSRFMPAFAAPADSFLAAKFKAAGLIALGTTNVPEFGLVASTECKLYGPARNPWNPAHSTGGSSGGSGAAVAAGIVPLAHANDGGGSIRIPAAANGLVGLKPSRGRISQGPAFADSLDGIATDLVVSRSVRDTAAALDAARGTMPGDPYAEPPGPGSYLGAIKRKPKKLRIAIALTRFDGRELHPDAIAAVKRAARLCEDLGHDVEEASPQLPKDILTATFDTFWTAGLAAGLDMIATLTGQAPTRQLLEGATWALYRAGKAVTVSRYLAAKQAINAVSREMARFHATYDVWITPTLARPPEKLGVFQFDDEDRRISFDPQYDYVPFTPLQNMTGQPAINLPLYWNGQGLPIGTQFVGKFGDDETLLRLAAQLEKAQPWFARYAAIAM